MSVPPRQSRTRRGRRLLVWTAAVVIGVVICGGIPVLHAALADRAERRKEDWEISKYLSLVQARDYQGAGEMHCGGDDTRTATLRNMDEPGWGVRRIEAVALIGSEKWSSWVDGHGRTYHVRLMFPDGATATSDLAVEVIGNEPCIATAIPF